MSQDITFTIVNKRDPNNCTLETVKHIIRPNENLLTYLFIARDTAEAIHIICNLHPNNHILIIMSLHDHDSLLSFLTSLQSQLDRDRFSHHAKIMVGPESSPTQNPYLVWQA